MKISKSYFIKSASYILLHREVLAFFVFAFVLRSVFMLLQPLSFDELLTYDVLRLSSFGEIYTHITHRDLQMPSLYLILYFIKNYIYENHLLYRLLCVFFSSLGVFFAYYSGLNIYGKNCARIYSFLYSTSFALILFGSEFRPYSPLLLISTIVCWLYLVKPKHYLKLLVLSGLIAFSFHYYGILLLVPYIFLEYRQIQKKINSEPVKSFISFGLFFGLALFMLPVFIRNYNMDHSYRRIITSFFGMYDFLNLLSLSLWGIIGAILCLITLIYFFCENRTRGLNKKALILLFMGTSPLFIIWLKSLTSTPTLEPRYLVLFLPPLILLISISLTFLKNRFGTSIQYFLVLIFLFDFFVYRNIFVSFRDDSFLHYKKAVLMAKENQLPLISCGACFYPYNSGDDNYFCYRKGLENYSIPAKAILILAGGPMDYCRELVQEGYPEFKGATFKTVLFQHF